MSVSVQSLGIDQLTVGERLALIDQIWDSLPVGVETAEVPAWHLAQLERRRADAEKNPGVGQPWRDVLKQLGSQP